MINAIYEITENIGPISKKQMRIPVYEEPPSKRYPALHAIHAGPYRPPLLERRRIQLLDAALCGSHGNICAMRSHVLPQAGRPARVAIAQAGKDLPHRGSAR